MRDPELIVRAGRAAAELERAWDRWRTMHGLGTDPPPPVSSYVGYSLQEPWGQPRVVFGIDAREAEQLIALLNHHDCAGPVYAAMTSPGRRAEQDADIQAHDAEPGRGRIHVPSQAQSAVAQREAAAEPALPDLLASREALEQGERELLEQRDGPAQRELLQPDGLAQLEQMGQRGTRDPAEPAGEARAEGHQPGLVAFRPRHEPASYAGEDAEPVPAADQPSQPTEQAGAAEGGQASAGWTRTGRLAGGHALPRQKRAGGAARGASKQEGKERAGLADLAAELAGWAAGELPGQASQRRVPRSAGRPERPPLG
jgi:hypothetical protein